ncbi:hypothetical protein PLIIFM63780_003386 [Purpureocillium lilacinum]|nr:hypothetical protein PLIIFM63780_003386 [Purpureocillium lilacinum]
MATEREFADIRTALGPDHPNADAEIAWRLQHVPPFDVDVTMPASFAAATSGLDCLAQVLRQIFSREGGQGFSKLLENEAAMADERANPILKYAWQTFERDHPEALKEQTRRASANKRDVLKRVFAAGRKPASCSFIDLCLSPVMKQTIWADERFKAWTDAMEQMPDGSWSLKDRSTWAGNGFLGFNANLRPWKTLQGFINGRYGEDFDVAAPAGDETSSRRQLPVSGWPRVMRIIYSPRVESPLKFSELLSFEMPYLGSQSATDLANLTGKAPVRAYQRYTLIAVVRCRQSAGEYDYVRTYADDGSFITMSYRPPLFTDDTWSIENPDGRDYVLFYRPGEAARHPHAGPEEVSWSQGQGLIPSVEDQLDSVSQLIGRDVPRPLEQSRQALPGTRSTQTASAGRAGPEVGSAPTAPRAMLAGSEPRTHQAQPRSSGNRGRRGRTRGSATARGRPDTRGG